MRTKTITIEIELEYEKPDERVGMTGGYYISSISPDLKLSQGAIANLEEAIIEHLGCETEEDEEDYEMDDDDYYETYKDFTDEKE